MKLKTLAVALLALAFSLLAGAVIPPIPIGHPRILLKEGEEAMIRQAISKEEVFRCSDSVIVSFCDKVLTEPPVQRVKTGKRLLFVSREALKRIFYLSYAYRVHGNPKYKDKAIEEMMAVSGFSDWNPSHFLDVGEMTMALAIGYDWLYKELSEDQKRTICEAIVQKGFNPSKNEDWAWFYDSPINWNQVCNAGLCYGALAIWDDEPGETGRIIQRCLETNPKSLDEYTPEGGFPEGYNYWGYGSTFEIMMIAAFESAFGSDLRLLDGKEGFLNSSKFVQMMSTPRGGCFNFGDCGKNANAQYAQAWMAGRLSDGTLLYPEMRILKERGYSSFVEPRLFPFFLICGSKLDLEKIRKPQEHFFTCTGANPLFLYRSGWDSPDDTYLGIKGGRATSSHAHVDASSFVFEDDSVGWAIDLGMEDYTKIEGKGIDLWDNKQYSPRWRIFRLSPFCHNILTFNGNIPDVDAQVEFDRVWKEDSKKGAEMSTSIFYQKDILRSRRQVFLDGDNTLVVRDSIVCSDKAAGVKWQMCTEADAKILDDGRVELSKDGHRRILSSNKGKAWITPAVGPNDYDAPNPGCTMVGFSEELSPESVTILEVRLEKCE